MLVSVQGGAPAGGSGMQYFVGDFDGRKFSAEPGPGADPLWVDHGADYYAAVSFGDAPDGRRLALGWMSNWEYAADVPAADHRGTMALPRALALHTVEGVPRLVQRPVLPVLPVTHSEGPRPVEPGVHAVNPDAQGRHLEVVVELEPASALACGVVVRQGEHERTVVGYDATTGEIFLDRTASGDTSFHPAFAAVHRAPATVREGVVRLQVVVDSTSVEVFGDGGAVVLSDQVFPRAGSEGLALFADGGTARLRSLRVTRLAD